MKLSFSTLACPDWSLAQVLDCAAHEGYDGVELRFLENDPAPWRRPELRGSALHETRRRMRDAGLAVACVDTGSYFHHPDAALRRRDLDEAERALELADALGAPGIRVFGDAVQPGEELQATRRWIADALAELCAAAPPGVGVWIESHGDFARSESLRALLALVPQAALGVVWDPANAFEACGESPQEGLRVLGPAVRHVHVKDLREAPAGAPRPLAPALPGQGVFDAAGLVATLAAARYSDWLSFEWEKRWHPEIEPAEVALPHFVRWARAHGLGTGAGPTC